MPVSLRTRQSEIRLDRIDVPVSSLSESVDPEMSHARFAATASSALRMRASSQGLQWAGSTADIYSDPSDGRFCAAEREVLIFFQRELPSDDRTRVLRGLNLAVLLESPIDPAQVVALPMDPNLTGERLIETANGWWDVDGIDYAAPNFVRQYQKEHIEIRPDEWHLSHDDPNPQDIQAEQAWADGATGAGTVVAVLDDGVETKHPDLAPNIAQHVSGLNTTWPHGHEKRNDAGPDPSTNLDNHGTHCAGLIAGAGIVEEGLRGARGVAFGAKILPIKIFRADRLASDSEIAEAIVYAARHSRVLSCSWTTGQSEALSQKIESVFSGRGALLICAAGNDGGSTVRFPASDPNTLAVGSVNSWGDRPIDATHGSRLDVVAPSAARTAPVGQTLFTTDLSTSGPGANPGGASDPRGLYITDFRGTSAAAAIVAGVAALVLERNAELTTTELKRILTEDSADPLGGTSGRTDDFGWGRVNAAQAITAATSSLSLT